MAAETPRFLPTLAAKATNSMGWVFVDVMRSALRATRRSAEGDDNGTNGEDAQDKRGDDDQGRIHTLF